MLWIYKSDSIQEYITFIKIEYKMHYKYKKGNNISQYY